MSGTGADVGLIGIDMALERSGKYLVCSLPAGMNDPVTEAELRYGTVFGRFSNLSGAEGLLRAFALEEVESLIDLTDEEARRLAEDMVARRSVEWKDGQEAVRILRRPLHGVGPWKFA